MKKMTFPKISTLTKISIWVILVLFSFGFYVKAFAQSSNIIVNWNNGSKIDAQDIAPGADYTKTASVINNSLDSQKLAILVSNLANDISLADFIGFKVFVGANQVIDANFKTFADTENNYYA